MNEQQLIRTLKAGETGRYLIGPHWEAAQVLDLWDAHVSRRSRRKFQVVVWRGVLLISARPAVQEDRHAAIVTWVWVAIIALAVVCLPLTVLDSVPDNEARHECVRQLGEDCKL